MCPRLSVTQKLLLAAYLLILFGLAELAPSVLDSEPLAYAAILLPLVLTIGVWRRTCRPHLEQ